MSEPRAEYNVGQPLRRPDNIYAAGRCTKCRGWIVAMTASEWSKAVKKPCPHCGIKGW